MSVFDIFSEKNKNLNRLCHYFYVSKKTLTPFLIDLIENNPMIVDLLCNNSVSVELFNKINNNIYSASDISYDNIDLFRQLPKKDDIQIVIDIIDKKINIDSVYQCFFCDNVINIDANEMLLERKIQSFFEDIEIIYDTKKVCKVNSSADADICIYGDARENDIFFYNGKKYISREVLSDSIITMKFDNFISKAYNPKFLDHMKKLKIVFQEDKKTYKKLIKNTTEVSNWIPKGGRILVKTNHLLYIIKNSNMISKDKDYYDYLVKKIFNDNSIGIGEKEHKIELIAKQVSYKTKENLIVNLTIKFDKEAKEFKKKEIGVKEYNLSVFLRENNLLDIKQISEDTLTSLLSDLDMEDFDYLLNNKEIIDKYTTRTQLNISFKNLYSSDEIKEIIKNLVSKFNNKKESSNKLFDIEIIYQTIVNGILYLIESSSLSDDNKEYYQYKAKKSYYELNDKDYNKRYQLYHNINELLDELIIIIGEYECNMLIGEYNETTEEKIRKIDNPIFSVNVFIKDLENFENISIGDLTQKLSLLTLPELMIALSDDKILDKYALLFKKEMTKDEKKKIILREIKIGDYNFNEDTINYVRRNNIDLDTILSMKEAVVRTCEDINPILRKYGLFSESSNKKISIGNVLGTDYMKGNQNILFTMSQLFDSHGDGYHSRSVGLLEYSKEEVMSKLEYSFSSEPIKVQEADNGIYIISTNGLHRFTILRLNYLLELMNGTKKEDADKKFTFVSSVTKCDFFKTYCNYILCNVDDDIKRLNNCFTKDFKIDSSKVKIIYNDGRSETISNDRLFEVLLSKIDNISSKFLTEVEYYYKKVPSFQEFIDNYLKNLKLKFIDKGEVNVKNRKSK